jgi:hypothetical protein
MDPTINNIMIQGVTTFKTDSISTFVSIIPLGLAVMITISLIGVGINFFKKISGLGHDDHEEYDEELRFMTNYGGGTRRMYEHYKNGM